MKNIIRSLAVLVIVGSLAPFALAGGKNPTCPACKMELTSKKDKVHTVAVKIKGKTYYCCASCNMKKPAPKKG